MTIQSLLTGLRSTLSSEYEKQSIRLLNEVDELVPPNIFIESLPYDLERMPFPYVLILPPTDIVDDSDVVTVPITIVFGAFHHDKQIDDLAFMDIFTLVERTKSILKNNIIIAGSYRLDSKITMSFDALSGSSLTLSLGELDLTYESVSPSYGGYHV